MFQWLTQRTRRFIDRHINTWMKHAATQRLPIDADTTLIFRSLQHGMQVVVNGRAHFVQKLDLTSASEGHQSGIYVFLDKERLLNIHDGYVWYIEATEGTKAGFRFTRWRPQPLNEIIAPDIHLSKH